MSIYTWPNVSVRVPIILLDLIRLNTIAMLPCIYEICLKYDLSREPPYLNVLGLSFLVGRSVGLLDLSAARHSWNQDELLSANRIGMCIYVVWGK